MNDNATLAELLARESTKHTDRKQKALRRAARHALMWEEEARDLVTQGRSLTELSAVGPFTARALTELLDAPLLDEDRPQLRRGFITLAHARTVVAEHPEWRSALQGDLQMHTLDSDGSTSIEAMAERSASLGHRYATITDHSKGLAIANGMDEDRLAAQGDRIDAFNAAGAPLRILRGIEMNLSPTGEGDMDPAALARLDLVLGAFHSKLRLKEEQTDRYLAAIANPTITVLAHPRGRIWNFRAGLSADWPAVFAAAAARGLALEVDCYPDRQDLDVDLLRLARDAGCVISIGTDAHHPDELRFIDIGIAAAILAGVPQEQILNFMPADDLVTWSREMRERAASTVAR